MRLVTPVEWFPSAVALPFVAPRLVPVLGETADSPLAGHPGPTGLSSRLPDTSNPSRLIRTHCLNDHRVPAPVTPSAPTVDPQHSLPRRLGNVASTLSYPTKNLEKSYSTKIYKPTSSSVPLPQSPRTSRCPTVPCTTPVHIDS